MDKILICAATSIEATACRKGFSRALNFLGKKNLTWDVLTTGIGLSRADKSLRKWLGHSKFKPDLIVSAGFAGALNNMFRLGDFIFSNSISSESGETILLSNSTQIKNAFKDSKWVEVLSVKKLISTRQKSSQIVDMESFALAKVAQEYQIPFLFCRLISDVPGSSLPKAVADFTNREILSGFVSLIQEPFDMIRFLQRAHSFPALLNQQWQEIGSVLINLIDEKLDYNHH